MKTNTILDGSWKLCRNITREEKEKLYILADAAGLAVVNRHSINMEEYPSLCSRIPSEKIGVVSCKTIVRRDNIYTYERIIKTLQKIIENNPYIYEEESN